MISWLWAGCWAWARVITEAGTGIMKCLAKHWNPLEHIGSYTTSPWKEGPRVTLALEQEAQPFLSGHVGGWSHWVRWLLLTVWQAQQSGLNLQCQV